MKFRMSSFTDFENYLFSKVVFFDKNENRENLNVYKMMLSIKKTILSSKASCKEIMVLSLPYGLLLITLKIFFIKINRNKKNDSHNKTNIKNKFTIVFL